MGKGSGKQLSRLNSLQKFEDEFDRIFKKGKYAETIRRGVESGELPETPSRVSEEVRPS